MQLSLCDVRVVLKIEQSDSVHVKSPLGVPGDCDSTRDDRKSNGKGSSSSVMNV